MKTHLALAVYIAMLLTGCTGMHAATNKDNYYAKPQTTPQHMGNGRRLESIPVADHPCEPANVYFIDETKGVRQLVIDWNALGHLYTFTLPRKGRDDLVKRIKKAGMGCPMPALNESLHVNDTYVGETKHHESYSFVRYWLDGDVIRFKAREFNFVTDPQTKQIQTAHRKGLTDIDPQTGQLRTVPVSVFGFDFTAWRDLETQWNREPYNGPVATPQVVYRIDKERFFEIVPYQQTPCGNARFFYNDTAKGIRTNVMEARFNRGTFIIDAANDQYLVAPILESSSGCQSGGSNKCAARLPYSTDAGRSWSFNIPEWSGSNVRITKDQVFAGGRASIHDLQKGLVTGIWKDEALEDFPKPRKAPLDTEFHCNNSDEKE